MTYHAPVADILFALESAAGLSDLVKEGLYEGIDEDLIRSVLEEAGKFAAEELAPLNVKGDRATSKLVDGGVTTPPGWKEAYKRWAEAGWAALPCPTEHGGQGLPHIVSTAVYEMWNSANLSFGLCPLLTQGAIDALHRYAPEEIKSRFLPKMVSGEWTGTMNLTEPQAGSDLGALTTRAVPQQDGTYRIFGTKIFITYGEHDLTDNIIHTVLARLPDAPPGTRGISFFVVPKFLVNPDGSLGRRNEVRATGVEHKLGIHASPTCVMTYGEKEGAVGYMIGEPNRGLQVMFVLMNAARLAVGVQGVAIAERATQKAIEYAKERKQGLSIGATTKGMSPIIEHPDVRRTLMLMKSLTAAARAICLVTAKEHDVAKKAPDKAAREKAASRVALLTPIAKAFSTDAGVEVASMGVQIHGGMGFIEETGAAQYYRDARILPIYEGTNGIQAIDLLTRKLPMQGGKVVADYIGELKQVAEQVRASNRPEFGRMGERLAEANAALETATRWMLKTLQSHPDAALAGATPYLRLFGIAAGGSYLARGALHAVRSGGGNGAARHVPLARFFAETIGAQAPGLAREVSEGADAILGVPPSDIAV
ncbi:MAG: acyl-CoA dehydrogenase [Hyphomicrobiaceae bacterium]|nr:MAG: acyl-CoA dehydrogenase [Hyphomicrobiaceae bacterium]